MRDLIVITVRMEELIVNAIETFDELLEDSELVLLSRRPGLVLK